MSVLKDKLFQFRDKRMMIKKRQMLHHMQSSLLVLLEMRRRDVRLVGILIRIDFDNANAHSSATRFPRAVSAATDTSARSFSVIAISIPPDSRQAAAMIVLFFSLCFMRLNSSSSLPSTLSHITT